MKEEINKEMEKIRKEWINYCLEREVNISQCANWWIEKILFYRNDILEEERERILEGINEFSHCKKWELDETTDFYLDASIEQIKELITPL